jgi:hypothetical protein
MNNDFNRDKHVCSHIWTILLTIRCSMDKEEFKSLCLDGKYKNLNYVFTVLEGVYNCKRLIK